jgi:hypothetical protein
MRTTRLIALTATIVACAATTASARPAVEPPGSRASEPAAATPASIAAHREQISNEQWQRRQVADPAPALLPDSTATRDGLPIALVVVAVTVPLGLLIVAIGRPVSYGRHRRQPTNVA